MSVNKLQGFYQLEKLNLPAAAWKKFQPGSRLSPDRLWTVRTAVAAGDDQHLPRLVGAKAAEAEVFATRQLSVLGPDDLVIYYPYFIADVSGVVELSWERTVIEAVRGDLWNLTTGGRWDASFLFGDTGLQVRGDETLLAPDRVLQLIDHAKAVRAKMNTALDDGETIYLEWSIARDCSGDGAPVGDPYLIFYEVRTVSGPRK